MGDQFESSLRCLGYAVLVTAPLMTGCAEVVLGEPAVTDQPIHKERVALPEAHGVVGSVDQDGAQLDVTATRACDVVEQTTAWETTTRERHNGSATKDWSLAGAGVLGVGGGTWVLLDAGNVYPNNKSGQNYNPAGPGAAMGYGVALLAVGLALLAIPTVDLVRTSGSEETVQKVKKNSDPLQRGVACKNLPLEGAPVVVALSETDRHPIGKTNPKGELVVDLDRALAETRLLPRFLPVFVGETEIGRVSTTPIMRQREEQEWPQLPMAACSSPTSSSSCAPVATFLHTYPDGAHAAEARAAFDKAQPALEKLAEAEAYKTLEPDTLRGCLGLFRAVDPDAIDASCNALQGFVDTYPNGAHAKDVVAAMKAGHAKANALRQQMAAQAAAKQRAAEAAERQRQAVEAAQARAALEARCRNACLMRCSDAINEASCFVGCFGLCVSQGQQ